MPTRRELIAATAALAIPHAGDAASHDDPIAGKALIAITLDLEMSRNFPAWEQTEWDYEKGNLDEATRRYAREACRRHPGGDPLAPVGVDLAGEVDDPGSLPVAHRSRRLSAPIRRSAAGTGRG